jgi:hypothetical protein
MKNAQIPHTKNHQHSKKSNMFTNLDNFQELSNPVRGEAEDVAPMKHAIIDRYNPAQPYLPPDVANKPKKVVQKNVANLVPPLVPPTPSPPKSSGNDFPAPPTYESYPPYVNSDIISVPSLPSFSPTKIKYQPPTAPADDFGSDSSQTDDDDNSPVNLGYRYKPPSFLPTVAPVSKPMGGYSYQPPSDAQNQPPAMSEDGYSYNKPPQTMESDIDEGGPSYMKPPKESAPMDYKPDFHSYHHYKSPVSEHHTYDHSSSHDHDQSDYPELIFDKPHGDTGDSSGGDMKDNDVGMMPPPPPADMAPDMHSGSAMDDNGFPSDFPSDFKFHHDFDDHDFLHHHHHHHTTTTTTTESPRENRFSYYYLGKKLYYLPLYFSVYFVVYVGALIIKAVLRHKIVYPNSWRPDGTVGRFLSKRSVDSWDLFNENLHEITGRVTKAIAEAGEKYMNNKSKIN